MEPTASHDPLFDDERRSDPLAQWLAAHIEEDRQRHEEVLAAITQLRADMRPVVSLYANASWTGRFVKGVLSFLLLLGGVVAAFKAIKGGP